MRQRIAGLLRPLLAGALALAVGAGTAHAQRSLRVIGRDLSAGVSDILYVWSSPARADRRDWAAAGLAGVAVAGAAAADREIDRWVFAHQSSAVIQGLEPFREGRDVAVVDLGSPRRLLPLAGVIYLAGFIADSPTLRDAGMGCAAALQAQATVHMLTLEAVQRERPLTADGDPYDLGWGSGPWERHAFFSGHASNVMSCASYWNERFRMGWVEPAIYAVALGIGVGRLADHRHWASDVVTGTILGYAAGVTTGRRARRRAERERAEPDRAEPGAGSGVGGSLLEHAYVGGGPRHATLGWRISF